MVVAILPVMSMLVVDYVEGSILALWRSLFSERTTEGRLEVVEVNLWKGKSIARLMLWLFLEARH